MAFDPITLTTVAAASSAGIITAGGKSRSLFTNVKNTLTTPLIPSTRTQDYTTVEKALKDSSPGAKKPSKWLKMLKVGHAFGLAWLLSMFSGNILEKFDIDSDSAIAKVCKVNSPIALIGGVVSLLTATIGRNDLEDSMVNLLDNHVTRFKVNKDGSSVKSKDDQPWEYFPDLNEVVLPSGEQDYNSEIKALIKESRTRGVFINLRGVIGCGKTMTAKAIARKLMQEDWYNKDNVQVWFASQNTMEKAWADDGFPRIELPVIGRIGGETVSERLERLVANAVKHYKQTGEHVVIILDEAHEMLGLGDNTVDPAVRSKISAALGKFCDEKLKKEMCQGVMVVATSNASGKQISAHLGRRFDLDIQFLRPAKQERLELIKNYLQKELKKQIDGTSKDLINENLARDVKNQQISFDSNKFVNDYGSLAEIGTENLFQSQYGGDKDRAEGAGLLAYIAHLEKRDMMHCDAVIKAVRESLQLYESGGTLGLKALIENSLKSKTAAAVKANHEWIQEIIHYFGELGNSRSADITRNRN